MLTPYHAQAPVHGECLSVPKFEVRETTVPSTMSYVQTVVAAQLPIDVESTLTDMDPPSSGLTARVCVPGAASEVGAPSASGIASSKMPPSSRTPASPALEALSNASAEASLEPIT